MAHCSVNDLFDIGYSAYGGLTAPMLELIQASLLCQILHQANPLADCSANALFESGCQSGFNCLLPGQLAIINTQLLCEILHSGGGGGQSCLTCSINTDPVDPPLCDCAIHYRKDISKFWYWDAEAATWFPFIV